MDPEETPKPPEDLAGGRAASLQPEDKFSHRQTQRKSVAKDLLDMLSEAPDAAEAAKPEGTQPKAVEEAEGHAPAAVNAAEVEVLEPEDFCFVAEGATNMVFHYRYASVEGSRRSKRWSNQILRLRKRNHGQVLYDADFRREIVQTLFKDCLVQVPDIFLLEDSTARRFSDKIQVDRSSRYLYASRVESAVGPLFLPVADITSPVPFLDAVTVELKPKCGIQEEANVPSRYRMLQYVKRRQGKIAQISEYDPIDLFSRQRSRVRRALDNLLVMPENNLRVFVNELDVLPALEEQVASLSGDEQVRQRLNLLNEKVAGVFGANSASGGMNRTCSCEDSSSEGLLDMIVDAVQTDAAFRTLLRTQCWACGKSAKHAASMLDFLKRKGVQFAEQHRADGDFSLQDYREAMNNELRSWSDDEWGMRRTEIHGEMLVERATRELRRNHPESELQTSTEDVLEKQMKSYLCRFLLGRMAMDASVMISFCRGPKDSEENADELLKQLREGRFQQGSRGVWYRVVLVDTDAKPLSRVPSYAHQLEEYARVYHEDRNK